MIKVKRALISVSDKTGLVPFAKGLAQFGVEILSTGGTAKLLRQEGISVKDVSDYTGFPEMLDGRVKTLHPRIHGGLLAVRDNKDHMAQIEKHKIGLIDMVVVNLYPFAKVIKKKNVSFEEAIENIDIGGPSMLRSAAKNFKSVAVVANPQKYEEVLTELRNNTGIISDTILFQLAVDAFKQTSIYDSLIHEFLSKQFSGKDINALPKDITIRLNKIMPLRYGENPHQPAAFYSDSPERSGLAAIKQLHGKELSFNNILDLNAAVEFVKDFKEPAVVVIKHNNPTGVCVGEALDKAFVKALACDPLSAFGGIIGLNKPIDEKTARAISKSGFMECVIAPAFEKGAQKILMEKKNLRLIEFAFDSMSDASFDLKKVYGGMLVQEKDTLTLQAPELKTVTKKKFSRKDLDSILFGWQVIKNVKSNAIVLVKGTATVGIGAGQTSRVDSAAHAISKAGKKAKGTIFISEAFLPKTDNVLLAAKAGIKGIVQTGGSIADQDVIKEADKAGIAMAFTGIRHFKH